MLTREEKQALAALNGNQKLLINALAAIKTKFLNDVFSSEPHEKNKREDLYNKAHLVDELKSVINDAVNQSV